jgi:hypothetical protein
VGHPVDDPVPLHPLRPVRRGGEVARPAAPWGGQHPQKLRLLLIATWGVYPIAYLFPVLGFDGTDAFVLKQAGYTIADILAKAAFGLVIYKIAKVKSQFDDPNFNETGEEYNRAPGETADPDPGNQVDGGAVRARWQERRLVRV